MTKQETIDSIIAECKKQGLILPAQIAYVLATVQHETNNTFHPVREAYWIKDPDKYLKTLPYYPYYGRGYVQLTWEDNYRKYAVITEKDLLNEPDLAMEHETAVFILVHGLVNGTFTQKKLTDYITPSSTDFIGARLCINGPKEDPAIAVKVSEYAEKWLTDLIDNEIVPMPIVHSEEQTMDLRIMISKDAANNALYALEQRYIITDGQTTSDEWRAVPVFIRSD